MCKLSIVSPVYAAEAIVEELCEQLLDTLNAMQLSYEIVLVEDCGPDHSWQKIEQLCARHKQIKGIKLSRNFGQHYAITAGLEASSGEWVVVMDCDLQDRPDQIPKLYHKAQEGFELVFAQRVERQDHFLKRLSSKSFYALFSFLTDTPQDSSVGNFGIYHRKVVRAILSMKDSIRYFPTMSRWVGFRRTSIPVKHAKRSSGKSSYTLRKLFQLAFDNMIAFSDKPLWLMVKYGSFTAVGSVLVGIYYGIRYLLGQITEPGYTSLILSIWFLSSVIITMLGVVGIYVGKTFAQVKGRPTYIIHQRINLDDL